MDPLIQIEYDRIKAGPHQGSFTLLHHRGPVVEKSSNVMERVEFILIEKPPNQHLVRLSHIYFVPDELVKVRAEAWAQANKARDEANEAWDKAWDEANKAWAEANKAWVKAWNEADKVWAESNKAWDEAMASADRAILALIPNCRWNGQIIEGTDDS